MEFVFPLCDPCSVAWGVGGQWVDPKQAWFADDPFVLAHPDMFSLVPPVVRSTTGRSAERQPLTAQPAAAPVVAAARPKARANG